MPIQDIRRETKVVTVVDNTALVVPAGKTSLVIEVDDILIKDYYTGVLMVTAGTETATATLDVVFYVKDSNGNEYTHTSMDQITSAGSAVKLMDPIYGHTGKVKVTLGDAAADAFAGVTVELVLKS